MRRRSLSLVLAALLAFSTPASVYAEDASPAVILQEESMDTAAQGEDDTEEQESAAQITDGEISVEITSVEQVEDETEAFEAEETEALETEEETEEALAQGEEETEAQTAAGEQAETEAEAPEKVQTETPEEVEIEEEPLEEELFEEEAAAEAQTEAQALAQEVQAASTATTVKSGSCGTNVTYVLDSEGVLTISGTGAMTSYSYSSMPWYSVRSSIKSVVVEDGVTSIGSYAFYFCTNLTSVVIGNAVTSIGSRAFYYCTSLASVTFGDGITSIGSYAFYECEKLTTIVLGNAVTSIGSDAFEYCSKLTSITIPETVTSIGSWAFYGCSSLSEVFYAGSSTSWSSISISYGNTPLTSATIYYDGTSAISACTVTLAATSYTYTGTAITPAVTVKDGSTTLVLGTDYTVAYSNNATAGTGTVTVSGTGSYAGTLTKTFTILGRMSDTTVTLSKSSYTYSGSAHTPTVKVKYGSTTLTVNTDYTVSYANNTNAGTATVTVTGMGGYTGTTTATFTIAKASQKISVDATSYTIWKGTTKKLSAKAKGTLTYSSGNTKVAKVDSSGIVTGVAAGTAEITISTGGTTNYEAASKTVTITVKALGTCTISSLTNTSSGIVIKWGKVSSAGGYYVYRKTGSGSYTKIKTVSSYYTSYTDTSIKSKNGTTYTYKVVAYYGSSLGDGKAVKTVRLTGTSLSKVTNTGSKTAVVTWKAGSGITGYQIQYSTNVSFAKNNKTKKVKGTKTLSVTLKSLSNYNTYYVRVRTYKTVSGKTYYSKWSNAKTVQIYPTGISDSTITILKGNKTTLSAVGTTAKATWSSSNKTVATVNAKGVVTAKSTGTATITAVISGKKYTCKVTVKEHTAYGSVRGFVTYYYNRYRPNEPDTNATACLVPTDGSAKSMTSCVSVTSMSNVGIDYSKYGIYTATVDTTGYFYFDNVPEGEYVLYVISKGTTSGSAYSDIDSYEAEIEEFFQEYLTASCAERFAMSVGFKKYDLTYITVKANQTSTYSKGFGITYI